MNLMKTQFRAVAPLPAKPSESPGVFVSKVWGGVLESGWFCCLTSKNDSDATSLKVSISCGVIAGRYLALIHSFIFKMLGLKR